MAKVYESDTEVFQPVIIELETQDEVDALQALLNNAWLGAMLKTAPGGNPLAGLWAGLKPYSKNYKRYFDLMSPYIKDPHEDRVGCC